MSPPSRTHWLTSPILWLAALGACLISLERTDASSLRKTPIVRAIEQARPAVVNIQGRKSVVAEAGQFASTDGFRQVKGMGTGVFIDERGYILTNYHVVDGVRNIQVTLADETTMAAKLTARDPKLDLAILKVASDTKNPVIKVGTSSDLMLGEPVIAVGNAYGYEHTITRGIISALHRRVQVTDDQEYLDLIQTDASINPGNSGGPLLNIDGEMIGVNVAVRVGAQGIGFAIPVDEAIDVAAELLNVELLDRVTHGVVGRSVHAGGVQEFVVESVKSGSPAEGAGIQPGDVITSTRGRPVRRALDFERALLGCQAGDEAPVEVRRGEERLHLNLVMAEAPSRERSLSDETWELLGLKLTPADPAKLRLYNTQYSGGLKIVAVRPGGPGAEEGIVAGDVLVGMHKWETVSLDNVAYILHSDEFRRAQPAKFYILRGGETLYGRMRVPFDAIR